MTDKEYLYDEYKRAEARYNALKACVEGVNAGTTESAAPASTATPTATQTQHTEQTTTPAETQTTTKPTSDSVPTPKTTDSEIVYEGKPEFTIKVGETLSLTFYGLNCTDTGGFAYITNGTFGSQPVYRYKLKETRIDNGFRYDVTITGFTKGDGMFSMCPYRKDKQAKRVFIHVR